MSNKNSEELANKYYEFIKRYSIINDEDSKYNKKDMYKYMETMFKDDAIYRLSPWEFLPFEKEKEILSIIFNESRSLSRHFFRALEIFKENVESCMEDELKNYYETKGIKKKDYKIIDEIDKLLEEKNFDKNIFSKETIENAKLLTETKELEEELFDYIENNDKEQDNEYEK